MTAVIVSRAGPLCTLQDDGRFGMLRYGIGASGPMDRAAFARASQWLGGGGATGIEFTRAGIAFRVEGGPMEIAAEGGNFSLTHNNTKKPWPARLRLNDGDVVDIAPGEAGNYGYLRFDREVLVEPVLGSRATSVVVGLGGLEGRALRAGDRIEFGALAGRPASATTPPREPVAGNRPIRVVWGLHADLFPPAVRQRFTDASFTVAPQIDRMGARLIDVEGVFSAAAPLSLVSDAIVAGDIQILGDKTPIVLLRDHQPTGGYARIATVITADLDRFVQMRPGSEFRFLPVTVEKAQAALRQGMS